MLRMIKKVISTCIRFVYRHTCRLIPVKSDAVLFLSFHGRGCTDNPKAIYEYMCKQKGFASYTFIWALRKKQAIPHGKCVRYNGPLYFYYLARCKYWVINCKLPDHIIKKDNQVYLQTWHGTPLKKLAHDIDVSEHTTFYRTKMSAQQMKSTYDHDVRRYDYMISPNPFCSRVFPGAFHIDPSRLLETGYPRNDFLSQCSASRIQALKRKYGLSEDKKVILYAPTWRDNCYNSKGYTFTLQADFNRWKEELGQEYIVLFKPHYLIVNTFDPEALKGFLYPVEAAGDINELYVMSDLLITDYSSVFFDYTILNRPVLFYMYDKDTYARDLRGFYFDLEEVLPGPIIESEDALLEAIVNRRFETDKLPAFHEQFHVWEDGQASKRVVDTVFLRK